MLKTPKGYNYTEFKTTDSTAKRELKLAANDVIEFRVFSNDGFKLIDFNTIGSGGPMQNQIAGNNYTIDADGTSKLPVIGRTVLKGLTIRQAEHMLEEKYAAYYVKPFVLLRLVNMRVIVFPGSGGDAKVINLQNNNTTLLEALAQAGGISDYGKAFKIKLIRGELKNPEVYLIDLSTIEGMKRADMIVQANDIIYVEPRLNISRQLLTEISPIIGLISSTLLIYGLIFK